MSGEGLKFLQLLAESRRASVLWTRDTGGPQQLSHSCEKGLKPFTRAPSPEHPTGPHLPSSRMEELKFQHMPFGGMCSHHTIIP